MKAIKCELCGSNHLIKQDGYFVCQHCETKYTLEEARKLIIEGTVDVSGSTVKIDNRSKIDNLFKLARRARNESNYKMAIHYYESILVEDPDNWEAVFYCAFLQAIQSDFNSLMDTYLHTQASINTLLQLLTQHYLNNSELPEILTTIINEIHVLVISWFNTAQNYFLQNKQIKQSWESFGTKVLQTEFELGNSINSVFEDKNFALPFVSAAWKNGIQTNVDVKKWTRFPNKYFCKVVINHYYPKIRMYDKSYQIPKPRKSDFK